MSSLIKLAKSSIILRPLQFTSLLYWDLIFTPIEGPIVFEEVTQLMAGLNY